MFSAHPPGPINFNAQVIFLSGQEDFAYHHAAVESAAAHLCYFTRRREEGMDRLSPETKDVLQHRVDPNVQEPERKAVEALLYTVGSKWDISKARSVNILLLP